MNFPIKFRTAERDDGSQLWRLVQAAKGLELNSAYFYLTFADFFGATCVLAEQDGECIGCVIAFRLPRDQESLFVWQICVVPEARRRGLGRQMIRELLRMPSCRGIRYVLATVTPDNVASRQMFEALAADLGVVYSYDNYFTSELFPEPHEEEKMYRIGPLTEPDETA